MSCRHSTSTIVWFRIVLRLADNPALEAAIKNEGSVLRFSFGCQRKKRRDNRARPHDGGCSNRWLP